MSTELPGTPRAGKYCPRCHAMTQREEAVCRQCGHRFRTGHSGAAPAPDPLNRTMQFVLPPLPPRSAAPLPSSPALLGVLPPRRAAAALLALLLAGAGFWLWHSRRAVVADRSPAGKWETTLHGKASANAHLEFRFDAGGTGKFSWRESGPAAPAGETPLRWHQNANGTLALALIPPPDGDSVSRTLTGIFSRPAWPLRVDRTQKRLVLGTLEFTEKQ